MFAYIGSTVIRDRLKYTVYPLLIIACSALVVSVTACGRRGDPVMIYPDSRTAVKKVEGEIKEIDDKAGNVKSDMGHAVTENTGVVIPDAPGGLVAVYTNRRVVMTWDDNPGQDVKLYRIYRSTGDDYSLVGETVTPAFTDSNVEHHVRYYYRVTAVGEYESQPSEGIDIVTGAD
jgi:hypothetical protein